MKLSDNALTVLSKRYLQEGETPEQRFRAIAKTVASTEEKDQDKWEEIYYSLMDNNLFVPNSPAIMNYGVPGRPRQGSACFVLEVKDDLNDIFDTMRKAALISKTGGGTGFNFSTLRPARSRVGGTGGVSSGPISFIKVYDAATESVKQGGVRKGANMGILNCLVGDTMIHTLDGRIPIKDLVGKTPYIYAMDTTTNMLHVAQANKVWKSSANRDIIRVWLDNDQYLDCTPDHEFMLSDGSYKPASELSLGDSLMAFHKKIYKDDNGKYRKQIGSTSTRTRDEHIIVANDFCGGPYNTRTHHAHHKDGDPMNNYPDNIEIISKSEHGKTHSDNLEEHRLRIAAERKGKTIEEIYGLEKATEWKKKMSAARLGRSPWNKKSENHKVIRIEILKEKQDVYDISVPKYHNFVANEVFVHNCNHPDIVDFVKCKAENNAINNFNLSVGVSEAFFKAVEEDAPWELYWINSKGEKEISNFIQARELFNMITEYAHRNGEPGIVFVDRLQASNVVPSIPIIATNPCK
jgi:ribonucleotide reductase alpha subunit